jgi:hypothetical protein
VIGTTICVATGYAVSLISLPETAEAAVLAVSDDADNA